MKVQIETMIKKQFQLDIPVFVISKEAFESILHNVPDWWGNENKEIYDNLIFIMLPATFADVFNEIGEPKEGLEQLRRAEDENEKRHIASIPERRKHAATKESVCPPHQEEPKTPTRNRPSVGSAAK